MYQARTSAPPRQDPAAPSGRAATPGPGASAARGERSPAHVWRRRVCHAPSPALCRDFPRIRTNDAPATGALGVPVPRARAQRESTDTSRSEMFPGKENGKQRRDADRPSLCASDGVEPLAEGSDPTVRAPVPAASPAPPAPAVRPGKRAPREASLQPPLLTCPQRASPTPGPAPGGGARGKPRGSPRTRSDSLRSVRGRTRRPPPARS